MFLAIRSIVATIKIDYNSRNIIDSATPFSLYLGKACRIN